MDDPGDHIEVTVRVPVTIKTPTLPICKIVPDTFFTDRSNILKAPRMYLRAFNTTKKLYTLQRR
jgi:hypothetical protein